MKESIQSLVAITALLALFVALWAILPSQDEIKRDIIRIQDNK